MMKKGNAHIQKITEAKYLIQSFELRVTFKSLAIISRNLLLYP